jgi:zinc transport system substrate-binding protein
MFCNSVMNEMALLKRRILKALLIFCTVILCGPHAVPAKEKASLFVSIAPQEFFVRKISGDLFEVSVMVAPGADAHTFEPKPRQMVALSKANIYFAIGVEFEKAWLDRFQALNRNLKIVRTQNGIEKIPIPVLRYQGKDANANQASVQIDHGQDHDRSGLDPHIWLSPPLVKILAGNIRDALQAVDPAHGLVYEANYQMFIAELDKLDAELRDIFRGRKGLGFMVYHPSWGYFANTYHLEQIPVEIEGKAPKPAQLQELITHAKKHDIKIIFVQPQFSARSADLIAREIGGQVAFVDPLAIHWADNLREVALKFNKALQQVVR